MAVIIETAALTFRLRRMGLNTPLEFLTKSQEIIERKKKEREENMDTNRPVSYTHLDVYKRQIFFCLI